METPVLTALVAAAAALCGALGNQWVAAKATLKTGRLELYVQAKASAYKALVERMGEFGCCPLDQEKYLTFLSAYETALIFASDERLLSPAFSLQTSHQGNPQLPTAARRFRSVAKVSRSFRQGAASFR